MTATHLDRVQVSGVMVAAAALLRLASPLFKDAHFGAEDERLLKYRDWLTLREMAVLLLRRDRGLWLTDQEQCELESALASCAPGPDVDFIRGLNFSGASNVAA